MSQRLLLCAAIVGMLCIAACGATTRSPGGPATDYASLVRGLRAAGATVVDGGHDSQPFFAVPGRIVVIDAEQAQVYEYGDAASAATQADQISADGSVVKTGWNAQSNVDWVAPPHFYESGKLLVIYVGSNASVRHLLAAQLGPQFAGA